MNLEENLQILFSELELCNYSWSLKAEPELTTVHSIVDSIRKLKDRISELDAGIKEHASQRLDDRCQLDDKKLYALVGITDHPGLNSS